MGTESITSSGNSTNRTVLQTKNGPLAFLSNPQERTRFIRFAAVGIMGAVVDFGTFNLLTQLTLIPAVYASVISFSAAVVSNFLWNRHWIYPDSRSKPLAGQITQFTLVSAVGLLIRTPLFAFLERVFVPFFTRLLKDGSFLTPTVIAHNLALAIAVFVVMLWNFLANRFWTYNDVK
jgi:putative flippase GtrA